MEASQRSLSFDWSDGKVGHILPPAAEALCVLVLVGEDRHLDVLLMDEANTGFLVACPLRGCSSALLLATVHKVVVHGALRQDPLEVLLVLAELVLALLHPPLLLALLTPRALLAPHCVAVAGCCTPCPTCPTCSSEIIRRFSMHDLRLPRVLTANGNSVSFRMQLSVSVINILSSTSRSSANN